MLSQRPVAVDLAITVGEEGDKHARAAAPEVLVHVVHQRGEPGSARDGVERWLFGTFPAEPVASGGEEAVPYIGLIVGGAERLGDPAAVGDGQVGTEAEQMFRRRRGGL
jgi:hypothetical protein